MPLDALCVSALVSELKESIVGGRIDKIHQPGRDELIFGLRTRTESGGHRNSKLLLSANPQHPRAHYTEVVRENPEVPPMFCMLLRKHLTGARIMDLTQPSMERVMEFHLEALDELGFRVQRRLVVEVMGSQSNLVLVDESGVIIDCVRRIEKDLSTLKEDEEFRNVKAGFIYKYPLAQKKMNPQARSLEELGDHICEATGKAHKYLLSTYSGLSPLLCREMVWRTTSDVDCSLEEMSLKSKEKLVQMVYDFVQVKTPTTPVILLEDGVLKDFSFTSIGQYEGAYEVKMLPSLSALLDEYYKERERSDRIRQKGQGLLRTLTNARDRVQKKIVLQEQELLQTEHRERLRELGDIVTGNLHLMTQGMSVLRASDFYSEDQGEIEIKLDPLKSPQKNAAAYYKDYNRGKKANEMLTILLEKGYQELEYLNSVIEHTKLAQGEQDLVELRQELEDTGYVKKQTGKKGKVKRVNGKPMEFRSSAGLRISVGKNNLQNDLLTTKQAFKSDIWFHTQKIHGSHVILWTEGKEADGKSLEEAAILAAWFSQGRGSGKIPVDYTPVKYVKKPNGARPGMVIYTTYDTAMVSAEETVVESLRKKK